jgi:hypothetical protein
VKDGMKKAVEEKLVEKMKDAALSSLFSEILSTIF